VAVDATDWGGRVEKVFGRTDEQGVAAGP
jgi:hypothetical protein